MMLAAFAQRNRSFIRMTASISGLVASAGDFIVTTILGLLYPGYSFIHHTESFLGTSDSPVAIYMNSWGIIFSLLLIVFALGLRVTVFRHGNWQKLFVILVILYGFGEGVGSGLFPHDHVEGVLTLSGKIHNVFGAIGGVALAFIPYGGMNIFAKDTRRYAHQYSLFTFVTGIVLIGMFLLSKQNIIDYPGWWQRLFLFDYHCYLFFIAVVAMRYPSDRFQGEGWDLF
ncbi:MAG: DUF998 domain-containing protein [Chryseolinea sp.]